MIVINYKILDEQIEERKGKMTDAKKVSGKFLNHSRNKDHKEPLYTNYLVQYYVKLIQLIK